jgi:hypothetical protein
MPIGFEGTPFGGSSRPGGAGGTPGGAPGMDKALGWAPLAPAAPATGWDAAAGAIRDAGGAVAAVVETLVPVTVEAWRVRHDGRECPECGPYDGSLWDEGEGPQPPLHPNCRCRRVPHHVEWRVRR